MLGPLYLLFVNTVIPRGSEQFSKGLCPEFNFESIEFFMEFAGMTSALWNSIRGTDDDHVHFGGAAGYALSRFPAKKKLHSHPY